MYKMLVVLLLALAVLMICVGNEQGNKSRQDAIGGKLMSLGAENTAPWTFRFNKTDFVVNGRKVTLVRDDLDLGFKAVSDEMLELLVAYESQKRIPMPNINILSYSGGCLFDPGYWINGKADLNKETQFISLAKVGYSDAKVAESYMKQLIDWKNQRPALKVEASK